MDFHMIDQRPACFPTAGSPPRKAPRPRSTCWLPVRTKTLAGDRATNWVSAHKRLVGKHADLRSVVRNTVHKIMGVRWVKAHLSEADAAARGIPRAFWDLNKRADARATAGVRAHVEDLGVGAEASRSGRSTSCVGPALGLARTLPR